MRIISGEFKGRKINPPIDLPVRPTTDFAKEALFNILNNIIDYEKCNVLDLFAGTGSISYEFISRGAKEVLSVDSNAHCTKFISKTAELLKMNNLSVIQKDTFKFLEKTNLKFDVIFADAPYDLVNTKDVHKWVFDRQMLNKGGWLIIEHSADKTFISEDYFNQLRKYGKVHFSFFNFEEDED